jgi:hypothetical protein
MSIRANCSDCGHEHNVSDELAGKKFRCKGCGEPVTVPAPRAVAAPPRKPPAARPPVPPKPKPGVSAAKPLRAVAKKPDDEFDFGDLPASQGEAIEDEEPAPVVKPKKKKKARSSSSGGGSGLATSGIGAGGLVLFCLVLKVVLKVLPAGALALGGTASWREWKHPTDNYSVEMPNAPKNEFRNGRQLHLAEVRNKFACDAYSEAMPLGAETLTPQQFVDLIVAAPGGFDAASGGKVISKSAVTMAGQPAAELHMLMEDTHCVGRLIPHQGKIIALEFLYIKTDHPTERARYFNSFKFN